MSDLQCAATLLVVPSDRAQGLVPQLDGTRVAHVWASTAEPASGAGAAIALALGVGLTTRPGLTDLDGSTPALGEIADEHRGETVVVVVDQGDAVVEVAIDGDGWRCRRRT